MQLLIFRNIDESRNEDVLITNRILKLDSDAN